MHECFNKILFEAKSYTRNHSIPKALKIITILSNIGQQSQFLNQFCSITRSWIELLKEQQLEGTTASCTKKAYISDSFVLNPQFSVYLSLFYYMTKVTVNVFKNHLRVLFSLRRVTLSLIYFSLKTEWKGKHNLQTCFKDEHLKQRKATGVCSLSSSRLSLLRSRVGFHIDCFFFLLYRRGREGRRA